MCAEKYHKTSRYPGVTTILSPWSGYDRIHPVHLGRASERGTIVHSHAAAYVMGVWAPDPAPEYRGYVESAQRWIDAFIDEPLLVEEELEDHELKFCGHPDIIARSSKLGGVVLIDLKTPAAVHRKNWGCQLAAYERLAKVSGRIPPINRFGSLRLDKNGGVAKFDEFTDNRLSYWSAFYGALIAHNFFNN
jgi:hypothetical protein